MGSTVKLEDILTDSQVCHIVEKSVGPGWKMVGSTLRPAGDGLGGFMGDHFRVTLDVQMDKGQDSEDGQRRTLKLFAKSVPRLNPVKIEFIQENGFFDREMVMFKLLDEIETGRVPWAPKGLFYNESIMVMPDLSPEGYTTCKPLEPLDLPHILVTLTSVARFHAAIAKHDTRKSLALNRPYSLMEDYGKVIIECSFQDTPWIRTAAKLIANTVQRLSKYKDIPDLEANVLKQFLAGFADLTETDSLNVVIHKDLWVNNIMFKYENGLPTNAIIVDFQCIRYGPPAFDIAVLLYFTTSRNFREQHEDKILRHYFQVFTESLDVDTEFRLKGLGYDYEDFLSWMDVSRRFGMVTALILLPYVMMDPVSASKVYNDPETFEHIAFVDRTEPVLGYAARCPQFRKRLLEVAEEFIERRIWVWLGEPCPAQKWLVPTPVQKAQKPEATPENSCGPGQPCRVPWAPKGLFYNESIMVMPDLSPEGYTTCKPLEPLDLPHILVTLTSVARFHAAIAKHDTRKSLALNRPYSLMEDYGKVIIECSFQDTPWIRTAAKLIANTVQRLSKYKDIPDLEANVLKQFLAGFADLTETDSLNVVIHKDLWVNNIMFKYENGLPTNAIIVDFQCIRYGPPAFDIAVLLYFTTSRNFREQHEDKILRHYFQVFTESLDVDTEFRLKGLGYDYEDFLSWMDVSRRFGMVTALILLPYVMMDPVSASKVYNDPETFEHIAFVDRTEPVLGYAARCPQFRKRLLEVAEEFIERYLLS